MLSRRWSRRSSQALCVGLLLLLSSIVPRSVTAQQQPARKAVARPLSPQRATTAAAAPTTKVRAAYAGTARTARGSIALTLTLDDRDGLTGFWASGRAFEASAIGVSGPTAGWRWGDSVLFRTTGADGARAWWVGEVGILSMARQFVVSDGPLTGQRGTWELSYTDGDGFHPGEREWAARTAPWERLLDAPQAAFVDGEASGPAMVRRPVGSLPGRAMRGTGSGFVVHRAGFLLTNAHVVEGCTYLRVRQGTQPEVAATVVAADKATDLALLRAPVLTARVAAFRSGAPIRPGDDVVAVGFPLHGLLAEEANVSPGAVTATAGLGNNPLHYQISAPVQPGNSGGPLLDREGRVVGVVVAKLDAIAMARVTGDIPQNINFAIKGDRAEQFLLKHRVGASEGAGMAGLSLADVGDIGRRLVVLVSCWH